ncbi:chemotaxis protein MotB [Vreelandella songnenensis]|uniref:Chemotaxis protein MotB n=1 Tax=Vreelandella songnenensis TaxID=1176243 RepID=A0A2T0UTZ7_9GAMM|nr:OmpA family protein [Halomonas songnenensis]PRY61390.1 chemotaxis protein MotB [Halomonas songnenensis]
MLEDHRGGPRHDSLLSAYPEDDSNSGWMISYIDIMTILVALFVIIIAAAGATQPEIFKPAPEEEVVEEAAPDFNVPLPEAMVNTLEQRELPAWRRGLEPFAISAALGVAGLPSSRLVASAPPPLLALATLDLPATDEPMLPPMALPTLLMPVDSDTLGTPLADYMVLLTDRAPVNVQEISEEAISSAQALQVALAERIETSPYLPDLEGVEVSRVAEGISLRVQDQLLFPSATADLTIDGSSLVGSLLETIQRYDGEVWVEGHSDSQTISTDEFSSNWALSSARAIAIVEALEAAGVDPERLRAVGLAATQPLEDNATPEGRARNRRVEVVIHVE